MTTSNIFELIFLFRQSWGQRKKRVSCQPIQHGFRCQAADWSKDVRGWSEEGYQTLVSPNSLFDGIIEGQWFRPFNVVDKANKPVVSVTYKGDQREFVGLFIPWLLSHQLLIEVVSQTPEEVSAMVLTKMKETAEAYLGEKVTHAVVTVPACTSALRFPPLIHIISSRSCDIRFQRCPASSHKGCRHHRWPWDFAHH